MAADSPDGCAAVSAVASADEFDDFDITKVLSLAQAKAAQTEAAAANSRQFLVSAISQSSLSQSVQPAASDQNIKPAPRLPRLGVST